MKKQQAVSDAHLKEIVKQERKIASLDLKKAKMISHKSIKLIKQNHAQEIVDKNTAIKALKKKFANELSGNITHYKTKLTNLKAADQKTLDAKVASLNSEFAKKLSDQAEANKKTISELTTAQKKALLDK